MAQPGKNFLSISTSSCASFGFANKANVGGIIRPSEVRLPRFRRGVDLDLEVIRVVFGTGPFLHRSQLAARVALADVPWGREGARVFNMDLHLQSLAAF